MSAVKGDERDMLQQLEMDGFNFVDVEWEELNLLDNEIMSSTDAIEEWRIESSTLRKRINAVILLIILPQLES